MSIQTRTAAHPIPLSSRDKHLLMDTRQLAAFCAVVERASFSRAAASLGVTQPAVSQQVRALEKRLGTQLLDRSGRRVVPTDAGTRLYRGAQRLLSLEEQLLDELSLPATGPLTGTLEIGASTGPAAIVVPLLLCEFHQANPELDVRLSVHDTQTVVSLVAERELELGIVGAARRRRAVEFDPFFSDEVILVCPPGHPSAGRTVAVDALPEIPLVLMQEGAGVRQLLEDELRRQGKRLRDLNVELVLGLQESVTKRGAGGLRRDVHLPTRGRSRSRVGHARRDPCRRTRLAAADLDRARRRTRAQPRGGGIPLVCEGEAGVIVRWGSGRARAAARGALHRAPAPRRQSALGRFGAAVGRPLDRDPVASHRRSRRRRRHPRRRRRQRDRHGEGRVRGVRAAARLRADDVLRRGVDRLLRRS